MQRRSTSARCCREGDRASDRGVFQFLAPCAFTWSVRGNTPDPFKPRTAYVEGQNSERPRIRSATSPPPFRSPDLQQGLLCVQTPCVRPAGSQAATNVLCVFVPAGRDCQVCALHLHLPARISPLSAVWLCCGRYSAACDRLANWPARIPSAHTLTCTRPRPRRTLQGTDGASDCFRPPVTQSQAGLSRSSRLAARPHCGACAISRSTRPVLHTTSRAVLLSPRAMPRRAASSSGKASKPAITRGSHPKPRRARLRPGLSATRR